MTIIALTNSKGGTGKTTLTVALSVYLAHQGHRVAIVDIDPHEALSDWVARRKNTMGLDQPELLRGVETVFEAMECLKQHNEWEYVFLDTPPGASDEIEAAMRAADLSIIPIRASSLDILASEIAVQRAKDCKANYIVVINDAVSHDRLADSAHKTISSFGLPLAKTIMAHRKAHITGMNVGKSGAEVKGSSSSDVKSDIAALWEECLIALKRKKSGQGHERRR